MCVYARWGLYYTPIAKKAAHLQSSIVDEQPKASKPTSQYSFNSPTTRPITIIIMHQII